MNRLTLTLLLACVIGSGTTAARLRSDKWEFDLDKTTGAVTIGYDGQRILNHSIAAWGNASDTTYFSDCSRISLRKLPSPADNAADILSVAGKTPSGGEAVLAVQLGVSGEMTLSLTVADDMSRNGIDFMMPVRTTEFVELEGQSLATLSVPYDNDAWVRFRTDRFGTDSRESYEVGAVFDTKTRNGIIAGSIDHDTWKSAVRYATSGANRLDTLTLLCGATSELTRDVRRHGSIAGESVSSPRFHIALTSDWRDGLERFADRCALSSPNLLQGGPKPFGWNSWGDLQTKVNFTNATEVSDFIHNELMPSFSSTDGTTVVNLDAFWDFGLNEKQHHDFVARCRFNGQKPGIYYCPFTDWGKNPDAPLFEDPQYRMSDLYLRHNGEPIEFDGAAALDPTHPGTRARIRHQLEKFKEWGYEYVKIDFMAHGAYEADSHFDPSVATGVQAFSKGMEFIDSVADGKMWINLSIAPLFPACYANSRRIGCDAWSDIGSTEYTMNALTYGWWLDHLYHYNDADHIVFKGVSEGENRARLTSSAITGVFFLGDDMSQTGDSTTVERLKRMATVDRINSMARRTKSFRPVYAGNDDKASDTFEYRDGKTLWVAVFNYSEDTKQVEIPFHDLGIASSEVGSVTELWTDRPYFPVKSLSSEIGAKDAMIFEIKLLSDK
ncbi:MAG: hypothetical protein NC336_00120 [Clostridium sp.]|nr:hypothetical protein [Clostridium sp.]